MKDKPAVFVNTSALFSAIWSDSGGGRMLLKLGEAGIVQPVVSSQVLNEIEDVLRRKFPRALPDLALLLDRCRVVFAPKPGPDLMQRSIQMVTHPGDAHIIAAAWSAEVDYLITHDRKHFLDNLSLLKDLPFPLGTPGDFLAWFRDEGFRLS